jgi:hypothetical protein
LFFQCIGALLDPANRKGGGIKWGLVAHTVAMFAFVTVYTATNLFFQSAAYIDNREYPGTDGLSPGPIGYQLSAYYKPIAFMPSVMFLLNNWLADGLLVGSAFD